MGAGRECRYSVARRGIGVMRGHWGPLGGVGGVGVFGVMRGHLGCQGCIGSQHRV